MDRPARVRMRRRKPCFLWRRRLFGWYVRFMRSFQSHDARERVIGPHRQPPSTTPVHDKGQRFQHTVRGRTRRIHPRLYTATRRGRSPTRRPPENRTVEVVHNRLSGAGDRISVSASGKHRFPAVSSPPTAFHMGYPHCGELMSIDRAELHLGRTDRPRRPVDPGEAERSRHPTCVGRPHRTGGADR